MRRDAIEYNEKRGTVEMRSLVDSTGLDRINSEMRKATGKGFTKDRTMRHIANIDLDEYNALLANMDKDALDLEASGWKDRRALRRLLARHPQWRCSEGGV